MQAISPVILLRECIFLPVFLLGSMVVGLQIPHRSAYSDVAHLINLQHRFVTGLIGENERASLFS